jgi:hypothetical protein
VGLIEEGGIEKVAAEGTEEIDGTGMIEEVEV